MVVAISFYDAHQACYATAKDRLILHILVALWIVNSCLSTTNIHRLHNDASENSANSLSTSSPKPLCYPIRDRRSCRPKLSGLPTSSRAWLCRAKEPGGIQIISETRNAVVEWMLRFPITRSTHSNPIWMVAVLVAWRPKYIGNATCRVGTSAYTCRSAQSIPSRKHELNLSVNNCRHAFLQDTLANLVSIAAFRHNPFIRCLLRLIDRTSS